MFRHSISSEVIQREIDFQIRSVSRLHEQKRAKKVRNEISEIQMENIE